MGMGAETEKGEAEAEGEETKDLNPEDGQVASSILSKVRDAHHVHVHI